MKIKLSLIVLVLFTGLFSTSCATIINGRTQKISVTTNPPGATVTNGKGRWITPVVIELKRKDPQILTIYKAGYRAQSIKLERAFSGVVFCNILLPFGGIDALTGAQWRLVPEAVATDLVPLQPGEKEADYEPLAPPVAQPDTK